MDKTRFKSMTSFLDMLWILLAGFGAMFIIAFLLIQPPAKQADIIKKAEYIIVMEWEFEDDSDLDLWVGDPSGTIVSFRNKSAGFMNLEKDDLGKRNDTIIDEYGEKTVLKINRETVVLRGVLPGEYEVMVHVYSRAFMGVVTQHGENGDARVNKGFRKSPTKFKVEVIQLNPYKIQYIYEGVFTLRWEEISIVRFTVDKDANWISFNTNPSNLIQGLPPRPSYDSWDTQTDARGETRPRL